MPSRDWLKRIDYEQREGIAFYICNSELLNLAWEKGGEEKKAIMESRMESLTALYEEVMAA